MSGRCQFDSPRPWQYCRPNASSPVVEAEPLGGREVPTTSAEVAPGRISEIAPSMNSRARLYASRCAGLDPPTLRVRW